MKIYLLRVHLSAFFCIIYAPLYLPYIYSVTNSALVFGKSQSISTRPGGLPRPSWKLGTLYTRIYRYLQWPYINRSHLTKKDARVFDLSPFNELHLLYVNPLEYHSHKYFRFLKALLGGHSGRETRRKTCFAMCLSGNAFAKHFAKIPHFSICIWRVSRRSRWSIV